jgi:hypothetical protein
MSTTIDTLKRAVALAEQIEKLQAELHYTLSGYHVGNGRTSSPVETTAAKPGPKKGRMSAAGKAAIIAAQKARWAKVKAAKGNAAPAAAKPTAVVKAPKAKGKRTFSPEARAKMAAAAKKRWAKVKKAKA